MYSLILLRLTRCIHENKAIVHFKMFQKIVFLKYNSFFLLCNDITIAKMIQKDLHGLDECHITTVDVIITGVVIVVAWQVVVEIAIHSTAAPHVFVRQWPSRVPNWNSTIPIMRKKN